MLALGLDPGAASTAAVVWRDTKLSAVPLGAAGRGRSLDRLTGTAVWSVADAVARRYGPVGVVVVCVPVGWSPARRDELAASAAGAGVTAEGGLHVIAAPAAVGELVVRSGVAHDGDVVVVLDAGDGWLRCAAVRLAWNGCEVVTAVEDRSVSTPDELLEAGTRSVRATLAAHDGEAPTAIIAVGGRALTPGFVPALAEATGMVTVTPEDASGAAAAGAAWWGARVAGLTSPGAVAPADAAAEATERVPAVAVAAVPTDLKQAAGALPGVPEAAGSTVTGDAPDAADDSHGPRSRRTVAAVVAAVLVTILAGVVAAVSLGGTPVAGAPPACQASDSPPPWVCIETAEIAGDVLTLDLVARGVGSVGAEVIVFPSTTGVADGGTDQATTGVPVGRVDGAATVALKLVGREASALRAAEYICAQPAGVPVSDCAGVTRVPGAPDGAPTGNDVPGSPPTAPTATTTVAGSGVPVAVPTSGGGGDDTEPRRAGDVPRVRPDPVPPPPGGAEPTTRRPAPAPAPTPTPTRPPGTSASVSPTTGATTPPVTTDTIPPSTVTTAPEPSTTIPPTVTTAGGGGP